MSHRDKNSCLQIKANLKQHWVSNHPISRSTIHTHVYPQLSTTTLLRLLNHDKLSVILFTVLTQLQVFRIIYTGKSSALDGKRVAPTNEIAQTTTHPPHAPNAMPISQVSSTIPSSEATVSSILAPSPVINLQPTPPFASNPAGDSQPRPQASSAVNQDSGHSSEGDENESEDPLTPKRRCTTRKMTRGRSKRVVN